MTPDTRNFAPATPAQILDEIGALLLKYGIGVKSIEIVGIALPQEGTGLPYRIILRSEVDV